MGMKEVLWFVGGVLVGVFVVPMLIGLFQPKTA